MRPALLALALLAAPAPMQAGAQVGPQPMFDAGEELEVELHADFNGDGHADVAYIVRGEDKRELRVATTFVTEVEIGENPPQVLALDPYPLGTAQLSEKDSARGKVLVLEDLTGGTTAVASTHRFRWDAKLQAMRLIGLDATLYSRTYAHDGEEASWNLLTGDLVTRKLKLNKERGYDKVGETTGKKPSPPLKLENAPSGDDLLGWPGAK
ncbi:hypothetical protein [Erythrobacter sp. CCH5-A1]|jgi:hypothetical protein|uniref:hypothetical protein n=1 Tax=Erythrobacter sp. CCH5-A1 TaxID=1768792 RepID=UPI00082FDADF|nr:hypothetical protein [Erythrobacter sp. CCH5-A1]